MSFPLGRQTSEDKLAGRKAGSPRGWIFPNGIGAQSLLTLSMVAAPKPALPCGMKGTEKTGYSESINLWDTQEACCNFHGGMQEGRGLRVSLGKDVKFSVSVVVVVEHEGEGASGAAGEWTERVVLRKQICELSAQK